MTEEKKTTKKTKATQAKKVAKTKRATKTKAEKAKESKAAKDAKKLAEEKAAKEAKEKAEREEFLKVVVPTPSWSKMPDQQYRKQPTSLITFANFYISRFLDNDLELMGLYDTEMNIVDINHYLMNNIQFTRKNLVKHILEVHDYNFQSLLKEIEKQTGVDTAKMDTIKQWESWYAERRQEIPNSLS